MTTNGVIDVQINVQRLINLLIERFDLPISTGTKLKVGAIVARNMATGKVKGLTSEQISAEIIKDVTKAFAKFEGELYSISTYIDVNKGTEQLQKVKATNDSQYAGLSLSLDKVLTSENFAATINFILQLVDNRRSREMIRLEAGLPRNKVTDKSFRVLNSKIKSGSIQLEQGPAGRTLPRNRKILVKELKIIYGQLQKYGYSEGEYIALLAAKLGVKAGAKLVGSRVTPTQKKVLKGTSLVAAGGATGAILGLLGRNSEREKIYNEAGIPDNDLAKQALNSIIKDARSGKLKLPPGRYEQRRLVINETRKRYKVMEGRK